MIDAVVYKLFSKNATEYYIGSTKKFHNRQIEHKTRCKSEKSREYNKKLYKYIRDNGGFDEWTFEILEKGEYENKKLLYDRERFFIEQNKPSLNCEIPNRTPKEHYQDNKEIISKKKKKYYQNNTEKICERNREYREKNKEKLKEKKKEKITCEVCNFVMARNSISAHIKTQKHIRNLNNTG